MRTTLAIDDDVLMAARQLAEAQQKSLGSVISSLARKALKPDRPMQKTRNGIPLLPIQPGATPATTELVRQLIDELM